MYTLFAKHSSTHTTHGGASEVKGQAYRSLTFAPSPTPSYTHVRTYVRTRTQLAQCAAIRTSVYSAMFIARARFSKAKQKTPMTC